MRFLILTALLLLIDVPAHAQSGTGPSEAEFAEDEARGLFDAGLASYEAGRFDDALGYFRRAYELSHRPLLLFNVGQCYDRLRHDEQAIATFEQYLSELPNADNRVQVEARIRALREGIARRQQQTSVPTPVEAANQSRTPTSTGPVAPVSDQGEDDSHRGRRIALITTGSVVVVAAVVLTVLLVRGGNDDYAPSPVGTVFALGGRR